MFNIEVLKARCLLVVLLLNFSVFTAIAGENPLTVVFCNDGHTNPYHVEWLSGFESALKSYNDAFGGIEGYWLSATKLEKQLEQVDKEIEKGVEILFVNAISVEAFEPLVKKAQQKGIIWVAVHNYMASADYNFMLGDMENGYCQGLALATYFSGKAKVAIMLGMRGNTSGEARLQGILKAFNQYSGIKVVAQEPADWDSTKALVVAEQIYSRYPDVDAISVVTDSYLYPAMQLAHEFQRSDIVFFGYDGDYQILKAMKDTGRVKADILLSATREGWCFVQLAYKIANNIPAPKTYNFYTPLVLSKKTYRTCLMNGFPKDIKVISVEEAISLAKSGYLEFGPESVK